MITVDANDFLPPSTYSENDQHRDEQEQEQNKLLESVESALNGMHWYTRELFKLYVHHGSAGKVVKAMKEDLGGHYIPKRTIYDEVNKVKKTIRAKIIPLSQRKSA